MVKTQQLKVKVYLEDAFTPVNGVKITLIPLHVKDSTTPENEQQEQISKNGEAIFTLPNNANKFRFEVFDERFYKEAKSNMERTTNSYNNTNDTISLNLLSKPSLYFNGKELYINNGNKVIDYFRAYSGNALSIEEKESLKEQYGYENFVSYKEKENAISYFCLDKGWQKDKDKGAIPEGIYYIDITQSKDDKQSDIREYNNAWYSFSRSKEGEKQWGKYNIPIYTNKDCTNTTEPSTKRQGFYIHGGDTYGNAGGIDLAKEIDSFVASIQRLSNQTKDNKLSIKLLVEYTHILSNTDLQSIDLHREIQRTDDIKKHRVALTANYTKPDSMSEESFNAQKQQTYWAYKELSQTEEYNTDTILLSELQFFKRNNQKHRGEQIEINLIEHQWHNYDKQIIVFAFSPKDILKNESGKEVLKKPKYKIITRGFRYDMLKRVFNGINYAILETTPTTQAQRNHYNEVNAKVQKLKDMVNELNRLHTDNEPMFVHYKLDTRARIEHFFAQSWVETWAGQLRLAESISKENANKNYNRYGNRPNTDDGYNFRGRGLLHLTFRGNYHACTTYLHNQGWLDNSIDFEAQPQLVTDSGVYALLSAVYYWSDKKCYPKAEKYPELLIFRGQHLYEIADDEINGNVAITKENVNTIQSVLAISLTINGGTNGLSERTTQHARIKNANIFEGF